MNRGPGLAGTEQNEERSADTPGSDLTGRERMAWNVLASWTGHLVYVVAGFILPRVIDRTIGQEALGIWDFAWSLVSYFSLAELGIGSSVSRYVAKFRAAGDADGVCRVASSAVCIQGTMAVLVMFFCIAVSRMMPVLFAHRLGPYLVDAQMLTILLGATIALQLGCEVFHGVVTGCHRWDLHNAINAGFYGASVVIMIAALSFGGGLRSLGLAILGGAVASEVTRRAVAYRVCPELRISVRAADWETARRMILFGTKTSIGGISRLILHQGNSLVVASALGPAILAVFSRPTALVRHAETFVNKFAHVLTPTAGALQARGQQQDVRELLVSATRTATALALPMILVLGILGNPLLRVWMGPRYEANTVIAILAAGSFIPLTQRPVITILTGLNLHGRISALSLITAIAAVGLGAVLVGPMGWGLAGSAVAVAVGSTIGDGIVLGLYACRKLETPVAYYVRKAILPPVACALPMAACLVAARMSFADRPVTALLAGCIPGGFALAILYWRYIMPERGRALVRDRLRWVPGAGGVQP